jgi:hypothetical protein
VAALRRSVDGDLGAPGLRSRVDVLAVRADHAGQVERDASGSRRWMIGAGFSLLALLLSALGLALRW